MVNKRGWIKVLEAFIAVLLIAGVLLFLISGFFGKGDTSSSIYESEVAILREIELNNSLRAMIINVNQEDLPVVWNDFEDENLDVLKQRVIDSTPSNLVCELMLCGQQGLCLFNGDIAEDIYARSILLSAEGASFNPVKVKLFCWTK